MRDDFTKPTIDRLAKRAGFLCSHPDCRVRTVGAARGHDGLVVIGVAAHITAASPGGPRYDASLTREGRRHQSNGVWLCQTHGKLVDSDEEHFTVAILREWQRRAEESSWHSIGSAAHETATLAPHTNQRLSDDDRLASAVPQILDAARSDLAAFKTTPSWPRNAIALSLRTTSGDGERHFDASTLASAIDAFNEVIVVAPPGTGKTTTLLQVVEAILAQQHSVAVFVPLGEWSSQPGSFFESITRRRAFASTNKEQLSLLADSGELVLVIDGWNELDATSRRRAHSELQGLKREFPDLGIVVSTRRQALEVPIVGLVVEIDDLTEDQQMELARALRGREGESLLDHAWRTPGVRELVSIPLYLTTLLAHDSGEAFPTTKEEVLRLFVTEHERSAEKAEALRELTFGVHSEVLTGLAVEATRGANTTISDSRARAAVTQAENRLIAAGQLASAPQPAAVLDLFVSKHLLVRSVAGGVAFQHQQFQEWYASLEVEALMRAAATGDAEARRRLRKDVLNERAWEESVLFACERLSRTDSTGGQAVAVAVLEAISIDPILAAEMIYRSSQHAWNEIRNSVTSFAVKWHVSGKVDRAAIFMITTGRGEFESHIWPLVSNPDDQVSFAALRSDIRFRPSVLGADAERQIALLPDALREHVVAEIALRSGMDGIELATKLAKVDVSAAVQVSVVEALLFRRADRFAGEVLRHAPDEVWSTLARKGYHAGRRADANIAERLRRERALCIESETDPLRKLALLLDAGRDGLDVGLRIRAMIESPEFPGSDQYGGVDRARQTYPEDVTLALLHRVGAGYEIPSWTEDLLRAADMVSDEGPIVDLVMRPDIPHSLAGNAAVLAGPTLVGRLIDELIAVHSRLIATTGTPAEGNRIEHQRLSALVARTSDNSLVRAVLSRSTTTVPDEIALVADLLARHGTRSDGAPFRTSDDRRQELISALSRWADVLLASPQAERHHFADVVRAVVRVASPQLLGPLQRLLVEDLARWRASREQLSAGLRNRSEHRSDAQTSWTLQYRRAFAAIGDDNAVALLIAYLRDSGFCGFGVAAAHALRDIWKVRQASTAGDSRSESPFQVGREGVFARNSDELAPPSPFADAILTVVDELSTRGSNDDDQRHALQLATVAFSMPYGRRTTTINTLLQLPQPPSAKRALLNILAEAGEVLPADLVIGGIQGLVEDAKAKPWLLSDQNWWEWEEWLELMPFTDRAGDTIATLDLLPRLPEPRHTRGLLSALGRAPSGVAEQMLQLLPRRDQRYLNEHDWIAALERHGSTVAARTLLEFICEGAFVGRRELDPLFLSRKIGAGLREDAAFRAEVYQRYEQHPSDPGSDILEYAIAEAADPDGILLLIRVFARQGNRSFGVLDSAIRSIAVGERPSVNWKGAVERFSIGIATLRQRLFALISTGTAEAELAADCLTLIDELRDEYGPPESEPRHPDIDADRPWPLVC